jgi:hypothetical protein
MYKKFFIAAGAIVLTAVGAFAGRMGAKSGDASTLWGKNVTGVGSCTDITSITASASFTTGGSGTQVTFKTSGGTTTYNVYSTSTCSSSRAVHFHI